MCTVGCSFEQAISPLWCSPPICGRSHQTRGCGKWGSRHQHVTSNPRKFVSEVSLNKMMGPFDRCPFPNEWNEHQARNTPLDTRRKDKYDPLSQRFRVISNFSAGRRVMNEWATRASASDCFTYTEIDSLAGLFQWVSTTCPIIISSVASLQALKHSM